MQPLLNKIVWVTGAGSGIGEAAALTLAKAGGAVVLTGRRREPLETVANRIRAEGGTAHVEPGDLMDPDAVKRIGAAISDKIGHLGAAAGLRRPDPLHRAVAEAADDERSDAESDLESRLRCGHPAALKPLIPNINPHKRRFSQRLAYRRSLIASP